MDNSAPPALSHSEPPKLSQTVNEREIAARVMTLLSHYWTGADSPEFRRLQMADWLEDLAEFSAMHVAEACKDWRRLHTHRPTPADIRGLTIEAQCNWNIRNAPPQIEHQRRPYRPPDVVRDDFQHRPTGQWTRAELEIANRELDEKAIAAGFTADLGGRVAYVKSVLRAGAKGSLARAVESVLGVPEAKEIIPP